MNQQQYRGRKVRNDRKVKHQRRAKREHDQMTKERNKVYILNSLLEKVILDPSEPRTSFTFEVELTEPMTGHEIWKRLERAIN